MNVKELLKKDEQLLGEDSNNLNKLNNILNYFIEYEFLTRFNSSKITNKAGTDYSMGTYQNVKKLKEILDKKRLKTIKKLLKEQGYCIKEISDDTIKTLFKTSEINNFLEKITFKYKFNKSQRSIREAKIKEELNILINNNMILCYPLLKKGSTKLPIFIFRCKITDDQLIVEDYFVNEKALMIILAYIRKCSIFEIEKNSRDEIEDLLLSISDIENQKNVDEIIKMVDEQINKNFPSKRFTSVKEFEGYKNWKRIERIFITTEQLNELYEPIFKEEIKLVKRKLKNECPDLLKKYIKGSMNSKRYDSLKNDFHYGSYTADYPINRKQWDVLVAAENNQLLSVNGPPGTGKTTVLKEIIANTIVKKAINLSNLWDEEWNKINNDNKKTWLSPLGGNNLKSIVVTSTNNKAVDNIGEELLEEVNYFSDILGININYNGILCARLGNFDNVEKFKKEILRPFINYFDKNVEEEFDESVKNKFDKRYNELKEIRKTIREYMQKRIDITDYLKLNSYNFEEIEKIYNKSKVKTTDYRIKLEEKNQKLADNNRKQQEIDLKYKDKLKVYRRKKEKYLQIEKEEKDLYKHLDKYSFYKHIKIIKVLIKPVKTFFEKYPTKKYLEDKISEIKEKRIKLNKKLKRYDDQLLNLKEKFTMLNSAIEELENDINIINENINIENSKIEVINNYLNVVEKVNKKIGINSSEKMDYYNLVNCKKILKKRNSIFKLALRVHEQYIIRHKDKIISNLKKIIESNKWFKSFYSSSYNYESEKKDSILALWETLFMCFPVVTTTLHSFRKEMFQPISELIDLLLVDEAGQILPHMLIGPMYRSRRAVVVGDIYQLKPIREYKKGLINKYTSLDKRFDIEKYSAQDYADRNTDIYEKLNNNKTGIILDEHRRCEDSIIKFSNEYVYDNQLKVIKKDTNDKLFDNNLIWFDVRGKKTPTHINKAEIIICQKIVNELVNKYGEDIKSDIGIITPFSNQALELNKKIAGVKAGTIHTFQGQERKIIIMSMVLDDFKNKWLCKFIGGEANMLNVAFTRAKEQVIIVGNIKVAQESDNYLTKAYKTYKKHGNIYSFYLPDISKSLTNSNVLNIFKQDQYKKTGNESLLSEFLKNNLEENIILGARNHYKILKGVLKSAERSIYIFSPWITGYVVDKEFLILLYEILNKGISVNICFGYTDSSYSINKDLNKIIKNDYSYGDNKKTKKAILNLKKLLNNNIVYKPPIHTKLLLADNKYLFLGSHNWLSNNGKADIDRDETGCLLTNSESINYIKEKYISHFFN